MKLMFLGAPGAGKGTQADAVSARLGIPTISTGNILREAVKNATPIGLKAKEYMDAGKLVPDDVIIGLVDERIAQDDCKNGFILDGMPRTIVQAEALEKAGIEFDNIISLEISDDEIMSRMTGRRTCPACGASFHIKDNPSKKEGVCDNCGSELTQRKDDAPETVRERLVVYHDSTEPLKAFYAERGKLKLVQSQEKVADTMRLVAEALGLE